MKSSNRFQSKNPRSSAKKKSKRILRVPSSASNCPPETRENMENWSPGNRAWSQLLADEHPHRRTPGLPQNTMEISSMAGKFHINGGVELEKSWERHLSMMEPSWAIHKQRFIGGRIMKRTLIARGYFSWLYAFLPCGSSSTSAHQPCRFLWQRGIPYAEVYKRTTLTSININQHQLTSINRYTICWSLLHKRKIHFWLEFTSININQYQSSTKKADLGIDRTKKNGNLPSFSAQKWPKTERHHQLGPSRVGPLVPPWTARPVAHAKRSARAAAPGRWDTLW